MYELMLKSYHVAHEEPAITTRVSGDETEASIAFPLDTKIRIASGTTDNVIYNTDDQPPGTEYSDFTIPAGATELFIYYDGSLVTDTYLILNCPSLIEIESWGNYKGQNLAIAAENLTTVPTTIPPTLTLCNDMFNGCLSFNQNLDTWDVSNVTDMTHMFRGCESFNQDLSGWDVSVITDMSGMFDTAQAFNQNLSGWNVSAVTVRTNFDLNATAWLPANKPVFP